jgi:hypothetical protein
MRQASLQLVSLLLLGVLIPFWILGEYAHHAECFGHHHSFVDSQASVSTCCSCHAHSSPVRTQNSDHSDDSSVSNYHKCSICDFFDQLNVLSVAQTYDVSREMGVETLFPILTSCSRLAISPIARGPPVPCLLTLS